MQRFLVSDTHDVRCPGCDKLLMLDNKDYLRTACHLRKCLVYDVDKESSDRGYKVCICGERFVTLMAICKHLNEVPHDWKKMRVLKELREM